MARFKHHRTFGFWKAALIEETVTAKSSGAHRQFGRITSLKDLPSKRILTGYIKQAMKLNDAGVNVARKKTAAKKTAAKTVPNPPADLKLALEYNRKALKTYPAFRPSQRNEYIEWITEAKSADTRNRRLGQAVEWT